MRILRQNVVKAILAVAIVATTALSLSIGDAQARAWPAGDRRDGWTHAARTPGPQSADGAIARRTAERRSTTSPRQFQPNDQPSPRTAPLRLAQGRPSAGAIEEARRRNGLPETARAVGWRLVDGTGGKVWKIIFRVGNRQVAVEVPAGG